MKVSDLIKELETLKRKYGDLEVSSFVKSGSAGLSVEISNHLEAIHDDKVVYLGPEIYW